MEQSNDSRAGRIPLGGVLVIAALLAITGASLSLEMPLAVQRAEAGGVMASPPTALREVGERFQPAAWYLPDEQLLGFVEIPAGPFLMGSNPAADPLAFDNEGWVDGSGQRQVELPTFYLG